MKKNILIYSAFVLGLTLSSCGDSFLDKLPDNRMEMKTTDNLKKLMVSAYCTRNPAYLLEMYSDNADEYVSAGWTARDNFQKQAYYWQDITETNTDESPQNLWESYYKSIDASNEVLKDLSSVSNTSASSDEIKGEALVCRAYNMFMLTNIFCNAYDETTAKNELGLPYPYEPETKVGTQMERGTLADVYEKIDKDLQEGLKLIGDNYDHPKFHFTSTSSKAFAARFYLCYQKYDKAISYATEVLGSDPAGKLRDWGTWSNLSLNYQVQPNAYVDANLNCNFLMQVAYSEWGAICGPYGVGDRFAYGELLNNQEVVGRRGPWGKTKLQVFQNPELSNYIIRKLPYSFEYTDIQANIGYPHCEFAIFTGDETLMTRAEAYALSKQYDKALADVNTELNAIGYQGGGITLDQVKKFYANMSYYTPENPTPKKQFHTAFAIDPETEEPLLQCILQLRRIVTIHEGYRMQDVKRYGITIYRRQVNRNQEVIAVTDSMDAKDPRRAIQLPQDVISAGMQPNPRNK
jgi:tetratricopeptide (TPR) repeat protein